MRIAMVAFAAALLSGCAAGVITGMGPSADGRMRAAVLQRFDQDPGLRRVDVEADRGVITLRGAVPDRPHEQKAVHIARGVDGVRQVVNRLRVEE